MRTRLRTHARRQKITIKEILNLAISVLQIFAINLIDGQYCPSLLLLSLLYIIVLCNKPH